jgi:hypothetical protein
MKPPRLDEVFKLDEAVTPRQTAAAIGKIDRHAAQNTRSILRVTA